MAMNGSAKGPLLALAIVLVVGACATSTSNGPDLGSGDDGSGDADTFDVSSSGDDDVGLGNPAVVDDGSSPDADATSSSDARADASEAGARADTGVDAGACSPSGGSCPVDSCTPPVCCAGSTHQGAVITCARADGGACPGTIHACCESAGTFMGITMYYGGWAACCSGYAAAGVCN